MRGEYRDQTTMASKHSKEEWGSVTSRYTEVISFRFLGSCKELRWAEPCKSSLPPCLRKVVVENSLSRGGHTHTAPHRGAHSGRNLNSDLTASRRRRKRRSNRKRARKKDRCRGMHVGRRPSAESKLEEQPNKP